MRRPEDADLSVDIRIAEGHADVIVSGELDMVSARLLTASTSNGALAGCHTATVDLHDVTFMDSTGLRCLIGLQRADGPQIRFGRRSHAVQRVIDISGLTDMFEPPDAEPSAAT
jgi:anti-anti-sigma factor